MYDALFFDLDGTLVDTESLAIASGLTAFAGAGFPVSEGFLHSLIGTDEPTAATRIRLHLPDVDLPAVNSRWSAGFRELVDLGLTLKPGVRDLFDGAAHLPRALVTSSGRASAQHKLRLVGLGDAFAAVVTLDDVTRAKPHPDPYLLAAEMLGVAPARCLVFEDSEPGAEAAHRAGCTVVQIPDIIPATGLWAHHVAPDLVAGARLAGLL
jgi:beta-phosphoglucomutase-like phosphatase (HAD superfamily)